MKALDRLCSRLRLIIHWITMLQYVFIFQKTITLPICKASIYNTYKVENTNYYKHGIHGLQNNKTKTFNSRCDDAILRQTKSDINRTEMFESHAFEELTRGSVTDNYIDKWNNSRLRHSFG